MHFSWGNILKNIFCSTPEQLNDIWNDLSKNIKYARKHISIWNILTWFFLLLSLLLPWIFIISYFNKALWTAWIAPSLITFFKENWDLWIILVWGIGFFYSVIIKQTIDFICNENKKLQILLYLFLLTLFINFIFGLFNVWSPLDLEFWQNIKTFFYFFISVYSIFLLIDYRKYIGLFLKFLVVGIKMLIIYLLCFFLELCSLFKKQLSNKKE